MRCFADVKGFTYCSAIHYQHYTSGGTTAGHNIDYSFIGLR